MSASGGWSSWSSARSLECLYLIGVEPPALVEEEGARNLVRLGLLANGVLMPAQDSRGFLDRQNPSQLVRCPSPNLSGNPGVRIPGAPGNRLSGYSDNIMRRPASEGLWSRAGMPVRTVGPGEISLRLTHRFDAHPAPRQQANVDDRYDI
jgi:hypothetical protein